MRLIAGLGNPGKRYVRTRHNAGFMVLDRLAARAGSKWRLESRFRAQVARGQLNGEDCLLCQPQTYMNLSGESVAAMASYFRVPTEDVLVVVDDADLRLGRIRIRARGSNAGHRGLRSVETHLGGRGYARLRVGIGRPFDQDRRIRDYVLEKFGGDELAVIERVLDCSAEAVLCWLADGIEMAMNRFNGVDEAPVNEG